MDSEEGKKKTGFRVEHMGQDLRKKGDEGEDKLKKVRESKRLLQKEILRPGQGWPRGTRRTTPKITLRKEKWLQHGKN